MTSGEIPAVLSAAIHSLKLLAADDRVAYLPVPPSGGEGWQCWADKLADLIDLLEQVRAIMED